ncbi:MAG: putrescine ABC transporter permease PotI [Thiotrichales bacterium]|nr:MAG: putrescine ABC transporter permease PotI [Thiotrichales bacterium]
MYRILKALTISLGLLFLYTPLIILIIYSFNNSALINIWGGFSTHWYNVLIHDNVLLEAAFLSLKIAISSATLAVILGTMIAVSLQRYNYRGKTFLYGMVITPLVMPDIIIGVALLLLFVSLESYFNWPTRGFITILLAHTTFCCTYSTIVIQSRLAQLPRDFEDAALDLGAKPLKTFFYIMLPQISTSIFSAWLISFTLSLDDFVITSFVNGAYVNTLPIYIYSKIKMGLTPEINAIGTVLLALIATVMLIAVVVMRRNKTTQQIDNNTN